MNLKSKVLLLTFFLWAAVAQAQLSATALTTDNLINPLGIGNSAPRFSWKMQSSENNILQTAYELRVAVDSTALINQNALSWHSGKVASAQSLLVPYEGPALKANQKYYWQVRIWDNHRNASKWSAVACWQMGLLQPQDWQASWIESAIHEEGPIRPAHVFRKKFAAAKKIKSATAYITAHGMYEAFINGSRVGDAWLTPGWTVYKKRLQYQAYDVAQSIQAGNDIQVSVGSGWYRTQLSWSPQKAVDTPRLALLFQLNITYADGSEEVVTSDSTWQVSSAGPIRNSEIFDGETYDARLEKTMHQNKAAWLFAKVFSGDKNNLVATTSEAVTMQERMKPVKKISTPKGELVLDFGQNMAGWVQVKLTGRRGDTVRISHAEVLDQQGNFYTENLRGARQQNVFILSGEAQIYQPHFTFQGFRYIRIEGYNEIINPDDFTAVALYSGTPLTGTFSCSDAMVNRLQQNIEWSQKGNFLDIPTDCPQRDERLGWTGDVQVFARTACFNRNSLSFFSKWLQDLRTEQFANGNVPATVPSVFGDYVAGSAGWGDVATFLPMDLYQLYGDKKVLELSYNSMKAWLAYVQSQSKNDLWNTGFHFGDWLYFRSVDDWNSETATTNKYLIAQCFWARSTQLMIDATTVLGKEEDAAYYSAQLKKIKAAFINEYITPGGRFVSGTQTAYVLALQFDMLPEARRKEVAEKLVADIKAHDNHLSTGFIGTPFICSVLTRFGYVDVAYTLLLQQTYPSWLYPITKGATTMWERWDGIKPDGSFQGFMMNSFNHYSYGAVGDWMYRAVAGIDNAAPGYKKISIQPHPDKRLAFAKASYESGYGTIVSGWERSGKNIIYTINIPPNTTAEIRLPGAAFHQANTAAKKPLYKTSISAGNTIFNIGSGSYVLTCPDASR